MIALTGSGEHWDEEAELRAYWDHLEEKPPLVGLLRAAVREFLVKRAREPEKFRAPKDWVGQFNRRHPPFTLIK